MVSVYFFIVLLICHLNLLMKLVSGTTKKKLYRGQITFGNIGNYARPLTEY